MGENGSNGAEMERREPRRWWRWVDGWAEGTEGWREGGKREGESAERCVLSEAMSLSDVGKGDRPGQPERQGEKGGECEERG